MNHLANMPPDTGLEPAANRHLTEAQAIPLAKPVLPPASGESDRALFKDGTFNDFLNDRVGRMYVVY